MHWLLLIFAAVALVLGVRTPSPLLMGVWFVLMLGALGGWVWLRYRLLFPDRGGAAMALTPLDQSELAHLREQAKANREAEAAAREAAAQEAQHPIHPVTPALHWPTATPAPSSAAPAPDRPITGRAVFTLPDDEPAPVIARGDRPL